MSNTLTNYFAKLKTPTAAENIVRENGEKKQKTISTKTAYTKKRVVNVTKKKRK